MEFQLTTLPICCGYARRSVALAEHHLERIHNFLAFDTCVERVGRGVHVESCEKALQLSKRMINSLAEYDPLGRFSVIGGVLQMNWAPRGSQWFGYRVPYGERYAFYSTNDVCPSVVKRSGLPRIGSHVVMSRECDPTKRWSYTINCEFLADNVCAVYESGKAVIAISVPPAAIMYGEDEVDLQGVGDWIRPALYDDMRSAVSNIADASKSVGDLADVATSILTPVLSMMQSTVGSVAATLRDKFMKVVKIVVNALMASTQMLIPNLLFNIASEFGAEIVGSIRSFFSGVNVSVQLQSFDIAGLGNYVDKHRGPCAATLGAIIAVVLQFCLGFPRGLNMERTLDYFGRQSRNLKGIFDFAKVGVPMFTAIGSYLIACSFGSEETPELDAYLSGYKKWAEEVLSLVGTEVPFEVRLEKDERLFYTVDRLFKQGISYASTLNANGMRGESTAHYLRVFKLLEELRKKCDYTGVFGNRPRVKPLVIQLFGESGVGKSGMTWPLACDLNAALSDTVEAAQDFASEIYFRNVEQEFFDGYAQQNIVVYDDFGQRADSQAAPNEEFMELIRAANVAPYPLHMADLPEKKRTKFCSKAVILTSNVLRQNVTSLTYPDAYRRRIDLCAQVTLKPEFTRQCWSETTGGFVDRLDVTKCLGAADTRPYLLVLHDPESMKPIYQNGAPLIVGYEEFLDQCLKVARASFATSQALNNELSARITPERFERLRATMQSDDFHDASADLSEFTTRSKLEKLRMWRGILESVAMDFRRHMASLVTMKNALVVLACGLAGFGVWKAFSSRSDKTHDGKFHVAVESFGSGDPQTRSAKRAHVEACTSGDNHTRRSARHVVEAMSSGDARTKRQQRIATEAASSADNVTRRQARHVVEGDVIEGFSSSDSRTRYARAVRTEAVDADIQAWKDATAQDLISHRVLSNLYKVSRVESSGEQALLNGLFVRDTIMLVPRHLLHSISPNDEIRISNAWGAEFVVPFCDVKIVYLEDRSGFDKDAMLLQFPRYVNAHSDLVKHFQTMPEISLRRVDVCLPTLRCVKNRVCVAILGNTRARCEARTLDTAYGQLRIRDLIEYELNTINGDCGAPVVVQETSCLRKIAGIHIAATHDGMRAFAQSVSRADLERGISQLSEVIITDNDSLPNFTIQPAELQLNREYSCEELLPLFGCNTPTLSFTGKCSRPVMVPGKTDILPSVIHGLVSPAITKPSALYDPTVNIMNINMLKNAVNTPYIPQVEVDRAVAEVDQILLSNRDSRLARVLTFEEAVAGSPDSEYMSGINRGSSAGYPWTLDKPPHSRGKTGWLGEDEYVFNEDVRAAVEERIALARKGIRPPTVWSDTLKDERRPIAKVDAKKTRIFSHGPMDYTIAFRMYFLGFIAHIMENRIENEQSLGTNVYSGDWALTARKLQRYGEKVFAGDFSGFDGSLNNCITHPFVRSANKFYDDGPENARIRLVIFLDVFNSIHLNQGEFLMFTHSQPSGNPGTTAVNSYYNSVSMRISYYRCAKEAKIERPPKFDTVVSMVSYGDDNVVNLSDSVSEWFNQETVSKAYASFGMTYTDEAKTVGTAPRWRKIEEVAYLKRAFRRDNGVWRAPMALETILETPNWVRKCADLTEATMMNVEDSIRELAQHPREVFDEWAPKFINAIYQETGEYPLTYPYDHYIREWNEEYGLGC